MKKTFLKSLVGKDVAVAEAEVTAEGFKPLVFPDGSIIAAVAYPNTVILSDKNGKVFDASAGDPLELE